MTAVLDAILASKRREIEALRARARGSGAGTGTDARRPLDVLAALRRTRGGPSLRLIAEHKRKSPSAGALSTTLSPPARALAYARAGAAMISVLCDEPFFDGGFAHLSEIRAALDGVGLAVPLLAKEFVLDEAQIDEARARGADAVLLIARIVPAGRLAELAEHARGAGLEPLVEVVDEDELAAALGARARLVGVNARDLDTLAMDAARPARVLGAVPPACVPVHLSGLRTASDVARVAAEGAAHAALIGEALMREDEPSALLASMVAAAAAR